jgi:hypothetical protein
VDEHNSLDKLKKFKQTSARKLMAALFCDRKGVLMVEFMQQGTITSEVYCEMLGKLRRAIQSKRHRMKTSNILIVLIHDNVHMHTTART